MAGSRKNRGQKKRAPRKASMHEILHGRHVVEEALRADRREFVRLSAREGSLAPEWSAVLDLAKEKGVPVVRLDPRQWSDLESGERDVQLQGCVLEAGPLPVLEGVDALCDSTPRDPSGKVILALDGVEDPQNVGSLARVADAAGAVGLLMTDRRSAPLTPALSRASAGAIEWQPVARVPNLVRGLKDLKKKGFWVLAADPEADRVLFNFPDALLKGDLVVVLGAEGKGLRPGVRAEVDHQVSFAYAGPRSFPECRHRRGCAFVRDLAPAKVPI